VEWGASIQLETGSYLPLQSVLGKREVVAEIVRAVDEWRKKKPVQGRKSKEREKEQPVRVIEKGRARKWREEVGHAHQHSNWVGCWAEGH